MRYVENEEISGVERCGGTMENVQFSDCVFRNCRAKDCRFLNCSFHDCDFYDCEAVNPKPDLTHLRGCRFFGSRLINISFAELRQENLFIEPVDRLEKCFLKYCTFFSMNLGKQDFRGNEFSECSFQECRLGEADFSRCEMEGTVFQNCDLRKADFRSASGYAMDTVSNKLRGARFSFPEVLHLLDSLGIRIE